MSDRVEIVHRNFLDRTAAGDLPAGADPAPGLSPEDARTLFRAQLTARALDRESRAMQARGEGFYTIGSSGHEGMAAVAWALRPDDIAFLHYRDAAFQLARAAQLGEDGTRDMLASFACLAEDPISGGRHKVLGSRKLMIPPQTSTIASHLPKAVGAAYSLGLARRHPPEHRALAGDGIVVCSFGDASVNHASAQAALNTAGWAAVQNAPLPLMFVCEDNGIGISTRSPRGWVAATLQSRPGLDYVAADGLDLYAAHAAARDLAARVRRTRKPAILHLRTVRLYGHAGADVATAYLPRATVEAEEAQDPLLHSVRLLDKAGALPVAEARAAYLAREAEVQALAAEIGPRPRLADAAGVMETIIPPKRACARRNGPDAARREAAFGSDLRAMDTPQVMSRLINWTLTDAMLTHPEVIVMGEDVGTKGGVYGVTRGLQGRFGRDRVMDTLLDETSILGLAIGLAHNGFVPVPEIQFLAYLHNAEDQLRGEAATLPFFSKGQFTNPMVLRIAGLGYQKGFGGHFHNDNSLAVLRDLPGVILACPSRGRDAVGVLREALRLAREENRVVVMLEPIALYAERDLTPGDGAWMETYPGPDHRIAVGEIGQTGQGTDLAIVSYGNGHRLSQQAARVLEAGGTGVRVIDLRWLAPLPLDALGAAVAGCGAVLFVDECRRSGNVSEGLMTWAAEAGLRRIAREVAEDSFIATGPAYAATMPSADSIVAAARRLLG
ncbi:thiamine pyrophosphate-dependent enzyme [Pseudaestuariivita atlantica]|uniref:2-oxoglutarate dehydrogenase E1 component n=1 Tax=Pseudaestuariivita atlantica TaxID=1317121 RepID=A0A0L1JRF3_9RHOB|nr:thiamine pyrophosphate-dependent enzyme [Pseudaestuariivita atlantica]KNG94330.1 MFS transporter [Pseudaestuariivita atlantica]